MGSGLKVDEVEGCVSTMYIPLKLLPRNKTVNCVVSSV